jgi:hypothetical protein
MPNAAERSEGPAITPLIEQAPQQPAAPAAFESMHPFRNFLILATVTLAIGAGCSSKSEVSALLAQAKLSPLPPSATNVAYYQWNGLFTGETYAKFELSPSDLIAFVTNSPSLQGIKPKKLYGTNYQHVPFPPRTSDFDIEQYDYFQQHPKFPAWYDLSVHGRGRKYVIDWGPNMMILIDDDRHIIWLRLTKG